MLTCWPWQLTLITLLNPPRVGSELVDLFREEVGNNNNNVRTAYWWKDKVTTWGKVNGNDEKTTKEAQRCNNDELSQLQKESWKDLFFGVKWHSSNYYPFNSSVSREKSKGYELQQTVQEWSTYTTPKILGNRKVLVREKKEPKSSKSVTKEGPHRGHCSLSRDLTQGL